MQRELTEICRRVRGDLPIDETSGCANKFLKVDILLGDGVGAMPLFRLLLVGWDRSEGGRQMFVEEFDNLRLIEKVRLILAVPVCILSAKL
jgi:hypothetical protein